MRHYLMKDRILICFTSKAHIKRLFFNFLEVAWIDLQAELDGYKQMTHSKNG